MKQTESEKVADKKRRAEFDRSASKYLFEIIPKIKSPEQAEMFLRDLMSSSEIKDLARRLLAVKKLYRGNTYEDVNFLSGMSMTTINKMHFKTRGSQILPKLLK